MNIDFFCDADGFLCTLFSTQLIAPVFFNVIFHPPPPSPLQGIGDSVCVGVSTKFDGQLSVTMIYVDGKKTLLTMLKKTKTMEETSGRATEEEGSLFQDGQTLNRCHMYRKVQEITVYKLH